MGSPAESRADRGTSLGRSPRSIRAAIRAGRWRGPTTGLAPGFCQANLLVVPAAVADAFEQYCITNPGPCPLIERVAPGAVSPRCADGMDLRTDLPKYCLHDRAGIHEADDATVWWRDTATAFLLGCSFTFEEALTEAGLSLRHQEERRNVSMYRTTMVTQAVGPFAGPLVVSMRPFPERRVAEVVALTAPYRGAHGAPVHAGDPAVIGIADLDRPDWGDPVTIKTDEVPIFWACGVTSQVAVAAALSAGRCDWAISHAPGHMAITDLPRAHARSG